MINQDLFAQYLALLETLWGYQKQAPPLAAAPGPPSPPGPSQEYLTNQNMNRAAMDRQRTMSPGPSPEYLQQMMGNRAAQQQAQINRPGPSSEYTANQWQNQNAGRNLNPRTGQTGNPGMTMQQLLAMLGVGG